MVLSYIKCIIFLLGGTPYDQLIECQPYGQPYASGRRYL